jgi:hypothetical protein
MPNIVGGLKAILEAARPIAVKTSSMVGGLGQALLKGDKATGAQWYNQLANKPGVKPAALHQALGHVKDSPLQMSKEAFLNQAVPPKLYTQKAYTNEYNVNMGANDAIAHELAHDSWVDSGAEEELVRRHMGNALGVDPSHSDISMALRGLNGDGTPMLYGNNMNPVQSALHAATEHANSAYMHDPLYQELYNNVVNNNPFSESAGKTTDMYKEYQRQPESKGNKYFETVLRQAPQEGSNLTSLMDQSYHFHNPGQIAHARGSYNPNETLSLPSGRTTPANHVVVDEIQSDPTEALRAQGLGRAPGYQAIKTPHGDMAKALLLQAAQGDANMVSFPSAAKIATVRQQSALPFYQNVYDDQLHNELYKPLDAMGIKTEDTGDWRNVILDPESRKALQEHGLPFKNGGVVPPYQPSKHNNTFMAGGLNLINPKNKNKGPLDIQLNSNNLIAKARAQ